jgi:hypothetical protein
MVSAAGELFRVNLQGASVTSCLLSVAIISALLSQPFAISATAHEMQGRPSKRYGAMKSKSCRVVALLGLSIALSSLSACFEESYDPVYGRHPYAAVYPEYVPVPQYYAYNVPVPHYHPYNVPVPRPVYNREVYAAESCPFSKSRQRWERNERAERKWLKHHDDDF